MCVVDIGVHKSLRVSLYIVQFAENMITMVIKMFTSLCRGTTSYSLRQNLVPDRTTHGSFLLLFTMYYYVLFVG